MKQKEMRVFSRADGKLFGLLLAEGANIEPYIQIYVQDSDFLGNKHWCHADTVHREHYAHNYAYDAVEFAYWNTNEKAIALP